MTVSSPEQGPPGDEQAPPPRLARAHERAQNKGPSRALYGLARVVLTPPIRTPLRIRVAGRDHLPDAGPAILAPNHKSFVDIFLIGIATRRQLRFMAKVELFKGPLKWLLPRLGAFPVVRGHADAASFETACAILEQGGVVVVFPEGTRVDQADALGTPHHGAGRLALATGAPVVPVAIAGTANLLVGPFPKPRRVWVTFLAPVEPDGSSDPVELIDEEVWPAVLDEYGRLSAVPGVVAAALAAIGVGGGLIARRSARSEPRILGVVEPRRLRRRRARRARLPRIVRR